MQNNFNVKLEETVGNMVIKAEVFHNNSFFCIDSRTEEPVSLTEAQAKAIASALTRIISLADRARRQMFTAEVTL